MIFLHDVLNYVLPCWSFTSYFCISKFLENDIFTNTKKMKLSLSLSVWSDFMQMSLLHISVFMGPPNHCHFFHVCNGVWKLPCIRCSRCPHCKYLKLLQPNKVWDLFFNLQCELCIPLLFPESNRVCDESFWCGVWIAHILVFMAKCCTACRWWISHWQSVWTKDCFRYLHCLLHSW